MLFAQEPTHVREKETSAYAVWIGIRVAILMVDSMIARPLDAAILSSDRLKEGKHNLHLSIGFVSFVGPEAVRTSSDSISSENSE